MYSSRVRGTDRVKDLRSSAFVNSRLMLSANWITRDPRNQKSRAYRRLCYLATQVNDPTVLSRAFLNYGISRGRWLFHRSVVGRRANVTRARSSTFNWSPTLPKKKKKLVSVTRQLSRRTSFDKTFAWKNIITFTNPRGGALRLPVGIHCQVILAE